MDIRNFFKRKDTPAGAAGSSGGGAGGGASSGKADGGKKATSAAASTPPRKKPASSSGNKPSTPSSAGRKRKSDADEAAAAAAAVSQGTEEQEQQQQAKAKKKKQRAIVIDDDDDDEVVVIDSDGGGDDDDDDFDGMSLDEEEEEDAVAAARPAVASSKAAAAGSSKPKAAAAPAPAAAAAPKKRGRAPKGPQMVIERGAKPDAEAAAAVAAAKKKSMAGQVAATVKAPTPRKSADKKQLPRDAAAAVSAVKAALRALPALDEEALTFAESFGGNDREPSAPGSKPVPRGHPDALTGQVVVFSGALDSLWREEAEELVRAHGGRTTAEPSGRTTVFVVGRDASRRKYDKASGFAGCTVTNEDGLLALVAATRPPPEEEEAAAPAPAPAPAPAAPAPAAPSPQKQQQQQGGGGGVPSAALAALNADGARFGGGVPAAQTPQQQQQQAAKAAFAAATARGGHVEQQLWVDKYKPASSRDLVGNTTLVANLRQWLHQWEDVHLRGMASAAAHGASKKMDLGKKAVLLTGPPGIGKTSAAHIIARELGYRVVEVNASDARNKSDAKARDGMAGKASNVVREMVTSTSIGGAFFNRGGGGGGGGAGPSSGGGGGGGAVAAPDRQVLVMDEVDGMSAGDRGGVVDLIATIKRSKVPIICIANDKYAQKLRSLRNHCLELDFRRPLATQIQARMQLVCQREGLALNDATLAAIAAGAQGDLRLILGQLQMARLRGQRLSYDDAKALGGSGAKDADASPFGAASQLLESRGARGPLSVMDQMELGFVDFDLVPLLVQENYVNYMPDLAGRDPGLRLRALAKAADSISLSDLVNKRVRAQMQWGLLPLSTLLSCVVPATYCRGGRQTFNQYENNFTRFSAWFGANSHGTKQRRLLSELSCAMAAGDTRASCSRQSVRLDYLPALRTMLTLPLTREDAAERGIPDVIALMQAYCIGRDYYDYVLDVTKFKSEKAWAADPLKDVATKTKSAFTRLFNQQGLVPKTNTMLPEPAAGRGAKGKAAGAKGTAKGGRGRASGGGADDDGLADGQVGDDDGVALAEEAAPPAGDGGERRSEEEDDDEDGLSPEQLRARLAREGVSMTLKASGGGGSGKGKAAGSGRGGGGSGRGAGGSGGRGRGRGRGAK